MEVYIEQFFVREGWIITIVVLLYAVLVSLATASDKMRPRTAVFLRLIVPVIISVTLHSIRFFMRVDVDVLKYVSDILYDYFAPIGIYRFAAIVSEHRRSTRKGGG